MMHLDAAPAQPEPESIADARRHGFTALRRHATNQDCLRQGRNALLWFERRVELSNFKVNLHNIASLYDTLLLSNKSVQTFATMLHFEAL
jgi:hypothetical protein